MAVRRDRRFRPCSSSRLEPLSVWALALLAFALVWLSAGLAFAQRELLTKPGQKGQVVIDQISGFRGGVAGTVGRQNELAPTMQYYGPIGFAIQRYGQTDGQFTQNSDTVTATTFWLAPSADIFIINHLSVGGMVEIAYTSNSASEPQSNSRSASVSVPSNTSFAIMPRVGYMLPLSDRWAIWPRVSLGYVSNAIGSVPVGMGTSSVGGSSIYGLGLDFDVGVLFRVSESFFLRLAPEVGGIPAGGNSTLTVQGGKNVTLTTSADYVQFTLTGGIGVMFDL
jgi:hypothetical protein